MQISAHVTHMESGAAFKYLPSCCVEATLHEHGASNNSSHVATRANTFGFHKPVNMFEAENWGSCHVNF